VKTDKDKQDQLPQRDRATRYVSYNLVNCYTNVRKIAFWKTFIRCVTLKVAQRRRIVTVQ